MTTLEQGEIGTMATGHAYVVKNNSSKSRGLRTNELSQGKKPLKQLSYFELKNETHSMIFVFRI